MKYINGTPYSDEQWKVWYGIKSSSDLVMDQEEREAWDIIIESEVDQDIEDTYHHHEPRR